MTRTHDWPAFQSALDAAELLILDFDGPICSVFSGLSASKVAIQLRNDLRKMHPGSLLELDDTSNDPFDVLAYAIRYTPTTVAAIEERFTSYEYEAVKSATPTQGAHRLINSWSREQRPLAVVSNNSLSSIESYMQMHKLSESISFISARTTQSVRYLKPAPDLLQAALDVFQIKPQKAVFIGDSMSDMVAGGLTGVKLVAFANKEWKISELAPVGDLLITHFEDGLCPRCSNLV